MQILWPVTDNCLLESAEEEMKVSGWTGYQIWDGGPVSMAVESDMLPAALHGFVVLLIQAIIKGYKAITNTLHQFVLIFFVHLYRATLLV